MAKPELNSAQLRSDLMNLVPAEKRRESREAIKQMVLGEGAVDTNLDEFEVALACLQFRERYKEAGASVDALAEKYGVSGMMAAGNSALSIGANRARQKRGARLMPAKFDGFMNFTGRGWQDPAED